MQAPRVATGRRPCVSAAPVPARRPLRRAVRRLWPGPPARTVHAEEDRQDDHQHGDHELQGAGEVMRRPTEHHCDTGHHDPLQPGSYPWPTPRGHDTSSAPAHLPAEARPGPATGRLPMPARMRSMPARNCSRSSCSGSCAATWRTNGYSAGSSCAHCAAKAVEERRSIGAAREEAGARGVLPGEAQDVVHAARTRSRTAPARARRAPGAARRCPRRSAASPTATAHGRAGRRPRGARRSRRTPRGRWRGSPPAARRRRPLGHDPGDDVVGGRREQLVLVGDVPVDRAAAGRQARGERAEGQRALAVGVEDLDRGLDDPLLRERVRAPLAPAVPWSPWAPS